MISSVKLFKCLADETRLNTVLLLHREGELCVCELMEALAESQPKVSRHLAQLRNCGLLSDTRRGHWVYYAINTELPEWVLNVLDEASVAQAATLLAFQKKLRTMSNRPSCC